MCTVTVMWLAGIPVGDKAVLWLPRASAKPSWSTPPNEDLLELRATLVQEHVSRQREGPQ